ncbi:nuclease HARBI1 [Trichonephila clavata]|uniref:Nuclease HARBI1 n=1 Tax=Trichonephila clavata TaxID=2740835 RepID=A0A8X6G608_TRICU|nr:nuclease HARBI1 [Trichonephila clavata]
MNEFVVNDLKINKNTVVDWYMFCREVCMIACVNESAKLGGESAIVEIDESLFGKMKYGRGKSVKDNLKLTLLIEDKLERKTSCNNALSPMEQVLIALRFYPVACMQLAIADLFDVSQLTVCRVVHRVSKAIASLLPDFIHLPVNREECKTVSRKFFSIARFPKVIGAPLHVLFLQVIKIQKGIVDADLVIGNVVARWLGSARDSTVYNNSAACLSFKTNELYKDFHLLGDTGYVYDPEPPADPQIEALVRQLELENDITPSFEISSRCPAGFAKRNVIVTSFFSN